jgi:hypothetical protein
MATPRLSQSPALRIAASVFATTFVGFGVNGMLRPRNVLAIFEFDPPASAAGRQLVDS